MYYVSWYNSSNTNGGSTYLNNVAQIEVVLQALSYDDSDLTIIIKKVFKK